MQVHLGSWPQKCKPEPSFIVTVLLLQLLWCCSSKEELNSLIRLLKTDLLTLRPCVFKVYECLQRFLGDSPTPVLNNATGVLFQVMPTLICHFVGPVHVLLFSLIIWFVAAAAAARCQSVTGLLGGCQGTLPSAETAPPSGQENGCI